MLILDTSGLLVLLQEKKRNTIPKLITKRIQMIYLYNCNFSNNKVKVNQRSLL